MALRRLHRALAYRLRMIFSENHCTLFRIMRYSPEQRAVIAQDYPRRVVAGRAGDAAAGMGAAAAMVKPLHGAAIVGVAEHRAGREELIECQRAMKDVAAEQSELPLQVERGENLPPQHACRKAGGVSVDGCDHEIGDFLAMIVPRPSFGKLRRHMLAKQARDMRPLRAKRVVERGGD